MKDFWANRVQRIFDRSDPIKEASDLLHTTAPEGSDRIYTLSRNERNKAAGMIRSAFQVGVPDFKTGALRPDILPLQDISAMVDGNLKELDLYMADQQVSSLKLRERNRGLTLKLLKPMSIPKRAPIMKKPRLRCGSFAMGSLTIFATLDA